MGRYKLVVFDWEGTIAENGLGYVIIALTNAAERMHLPKLDIQKAHQVVALGLVEAVRQLFPSLSLYQQEELCKEAQKMLMEASATVQLMPGVKELIVWLFEAGVHMAIATNKSAQGLARVMRLSSLDDYILITRTATESPPKPCPQMLEEIMQYFALTAEDTLMIGDSSSDMEMAAALNVEAIGMDFFQTEEQTLRMAGARHVFQNYQQVFAYIKDN